MIIKCRYCGGIFFNKPLLTYNNVPCGAQLFDNQVPISYNVQQCSNCGLVQLDCEPVVYYKDVIRAVGFSSTVYDFRNKQFSTLLNNATTNQCTVLEFGCGNGEYLSIFKELGADVFGVEHNSTSIEHCHNIGLNNVYSGYDNIDIVNYTNKKIDIICSFNFLEHCINLKKYIKNVYNNMSYDTLGIIEVPNFDMIIKNGIFWEFIRDHIFYFTQDTLTNIFIQSGFDIIDRYTAMDNYILGIAIKKRIPLNIDKFIYNYNNVINSINQYINTFDNIAIYGAGHQTMMLLSIINSKNISCIIDDAIFKQNKCVNNIPIVSLKNSTQYKPSAIIVIGGGYNKEMLQKIKPYYVNIPIAVLSYDKMEILPNV